MAASNQGGTTHMSVSGADGLSLQLRQWSLDGPCLLFLHGFDNDSHVWDEFAPALAPYYRTLAIDQRRHGESSWDPEGRYDNETMARPRRSLADRRARRSSSWAVRNSGL